MKWLTLMKLKKEKMISIFEKGFNLKDFTSLLETYVLLSL